MLLTSTAGLGRACMVPPGLLSLHSTPRAPAAARVWAQAARASTHCHRRSAVCPTASKEEGVAAVGSDLNWGHVAWDVKCRLAAVVEKKQSVLDHLQNWCEAHAAVRHLCDAARAGHASNSAGVLRSQGTQPAPSTIVYAG